MFRGQESSRPVTFNLRDTSYKESNPDSTRKQCKNCILWIQQREECFVHEPSLYVPETAICHEHVFGTPMQEIPTRENTKLLNPDFSGFEVIPEGSSCDTCEYYSPLGRSGGTCKAVYDEEGEHPNVDALALCNKWTLRG